METVWKMEWDFLRWKEYGKHGPYMQKDWNQTLMTCINQISAQIHKACLRGGADTVYINSALEPIFESLEYYWPNHKILSDRYKIIIDDTLDKDIIYVTNEKILAEPVFIPKTIMGEVTSEKVLENGNYQVETEIIDVSFIPAEEFTKQEVDNYLNKLRGKITIKNYPVI